MEISGYSLAREAWRDSRYVFLRGVRADSAPILAKCPLQDAFASALENEFDLLHELRVPGVTAALELAPAASGPVLILEDRGFQPLRSAPRTGAIEPVLRAAGAICDVLGELHQRGIVHGNISPQSIFVKGGDVQLADFTLAFRAGADAAISPVQQLPDDSLPYTSPERTGRTNRPLDHRTDFYSLGALLYELLTGVRPFNALEPLELIHAHIAKTPRPPSGIDPAIPEPLSRIVLKLLSKNAEDRYETAAGLRHDLDVCAREFVSGRNVEPSVLGSRDVSDRFAIPRRLYGRDEELRTLSEACECACEGRATMAIVSGYSGIGKTALIEELYRPIVRKRGYFASGKCDYLVRNRPYAALVQAFRGLMRQLLAESDASLAHWRELLGQAAGANGGVLAEVLPEIELILGKQTAPARLEPAEVQNRFRYVLQNFVGALAGRDHPLVVFLDDLQWADSATLSLLQPLLTSVAVRHLLFVGSYRDNEVDAAHPLARTLDALESAGVRLRRVSLGPLRLRELTELVRDTLHDDLDEAEPLARVIEEKTAGNPFFVVQFLTALAREGLLKFDRSLSRWTYRLDAINGAAFTDNVIDLMVRKIRRLTPKTQEMLTLAACAGNRFDASTLAILSRQDATDLAADLGEALREGLILPSESGGTYTFLHDRVQQAASALIPEVRRKEVHLTAGRVLLARLDASATDEMLFDIAQHLNRGSSLIRDDAERLRVAELDLRAGRKAKSFAAHHSALMYLRAGLDLLDARHWRSDYGLMWNLQVEAAECEYLTGQFAEAESRFELLLAEARTDLDRAQIQNLRIVQYETMSRYGDAVRCGREALALLGVSLPGDAPEKEAALEAEVSAIGSLVEGRSIEALVDLPAMEQPDKRAVMRLLTALWASAYLGGDQAFTRLISATMVRFSLEYGNSEESAYGYVTHAITVGPVRGDYESAYKWGRLALSVNERLNDRKRRAKVHQQFNAHVNLWRQPLESSIEHAREACRSGLETGDFTYAGYGALTETWAALLTSPHLERFAATCSASVALLEKIRMAGLVPVQRLLLNWARALEGQTRGNLSLSDESFDEEQFAEAFGAHPFSMTFYHVVKLSLCVIFEDDAGAIDAAKKAREVVQHLSGTIWPVLLDFYHGLTLAALCHGASADDRGRYLSELGEMRASLQALASNCPENFACMAVLVGAGMHAASGRALEAMAAYEEAMRLARTHRRIACEALANDLYARFWRDRGNNAIAALYAHEAARVYARWGAKAKVRRIEEEYPAFRPTGADSGAISLDIGSITKAARAIASEMVHEDLIGRLIAIAIENAGAERGVYITEADGGLVVEAEGTVEAIRPVGAALDERSDLARSVVRYCRKTGESIVVADAAADERFAEDEYIASAHAKSLLSVPVMHQGKFGGILYLENNLAVGVFTPERIRVIDVLTAQAAISLENARVYSEMKAEIARRRDAEEKLRKAIAQVQALRKRLETENVYLQEEIRREHNFEEIVGNSPALLTVLERVENVAPTDATVLIFGETGTGKELIARAIHDRSRRKERALVKVNCGAISAGLVESELFGHVKGAFTGALERRVGRFEVADGGTLFLDEVSELPLETQVKLLRVLQEGEFEPVGSSKSVRVDVRIITATNRRLEEAVAAGRFRSDLFYRLNVFPLEVPPLRARRSDIPQLAMFFLSRFARKLGRPMDRLSQEALDLLMRYAWPGNVRELQNLIERAIVLCRGPVLTLDPALLPAAAVQETAPEEKSAAAAAAVSSVPADTTLEEIERRHIVSTLEQARWIIEGPKGAARILGLHPNTLRSRMKKLGIRRAT